MFQTQLKQRVLLTEHVHAPKHSILAAGTSSCSPTSMNCRSWAMLACELSRCIFTYSISFHMILALGFFGLAKGFFTLFWWAANLHSCSTRGICSLRHFECSHTRTGHNSVIIHSAKYKYIYCIQPSDKN